MRFLLDENIHRKLLKFFHNLGHDATFVAKGTSDATIITLAKSEDRIIITHDTDFTDTDRYSLNSHCGIIVVRINSLYQDVIKKQLQKFMASPDGEFKNPEVFTVFDDSITKLS